MSCVLMFVAVYTDRMIEHLPTFASCWVQAQPLTTSPASLDSAEFSGGNEYFSIFQPSIALFTTVGPCLCSETAAAAVAEIGLLLRKSVCAEARSINRALEQQRRHDREEIEALRDENDALLNELDRVRALLEQARFEERRLSAALTKQASLASNEGKKKDRSLPADNKDRLTRNTRTNSSISSIGSTSGGSSNSDGITDYDLSSSRTSIDSSTYSSSARQEEEESESPPAAPAPAPAAAPAPAPPVAAPELREDDRGRHLPDMLEQRARQCLTGTVSGWVKGMQAACSESLRQALVLPWVLHKLFYLSTELIDDRREELVNIFVAEGGEGAGAEESAYMLRHLRRHYLTIFPLSGDSLKTAIHKVMMALAHRYAQQTNSLSTWRSIVSLCGRVLFASCPRVGSYIDEPP